MDIIDTVDVAIVGAGPIGTTLAMDLRSRGLSVVVVERRSIDVAWTARCNTIASRSMELFRRLGVADGLREMGPPADFANDVGWYTRANGRELMRVHLPSRAERFTDMDALDSDWPTPEPVHRCSQLLFEPFLREQAIEKWGVRFLALTEAGDFQQDADGVTLAVRPVDTTDEWRGIRARFLVGCDGGGSRIRSRMGARLSGDDELYRSRSALIRAPWMNSHIEGSTPWLSLFLGPGQTGNMMAINGEDLWLVHLTLPRGSRDFNDIDVEQGIREVLQLDATQQFEIVHLQDWVARRLVSDRLRVGRVLLAGDAAHLWPPFGGHGMNTGLADVASLGWQLAAVVQGWGSLAMIESYEAERLPVADQISRFAMDKVLNYTRENSGSGYGRAELDLDGPEGDAFRANVARHLRTVNAAQYATIGLNYGYYFDRSPIIAYDGETPPTYDMGSYVPSTAPGCRLPHFWQGEGESVYDALGPAYSILRFDPALEVDGLVGAARAVGMPLTLVDCARQDPELFRHDLMIVRCDQHIAWRGDKAPEQPAELIDLLRAARANQTIDQSSSLSLSAGLLQPSKLTQAELEDA